MTDYQSDKNTPVVTVVYRHRHGTDAWTCDSQEVAYMSVMNAIYNSLDEIEGRKQKKILKLMKNKEYVDAIVAWCDEVEEDFDFVPGFLMRKVTAIDAMKEAVDGTRD